MFKRSPADRAGFESGDVIVSVDGESILGEPSDLVVARIKGPEGSEVTLGVRKGGKGRPESYTLTREEIRVPVTAGLVREVDGRRLGYVRFSTFSSGASVALRRAVERVLDKGAEGIVLDLRANGGGLLPEAVLTSSIFVPEGDVVVKTSSRTQGDETYLALGDDIDPPPMVVLVNRDTASAAEILAALQSNNDDPVVGTRTFGKGVFQQVLNLENGGALDLTVGEFLTADGVSLAGKGLKPEVQSHRNGRTPGATYSLIVPSRFLATKSPPNRAPDGEPEAARQGPGRSRRAPRGPAQPARTVHRRKTSL